MLSDLFSCTPIYYYDLDDLFCICFDDVRIKPCSTLARVNEESCDTYGRTHARGPDGLVGWNGNQALFNCLKSPDGNIRFCVSVECVRLRRISSVAVYWPLRDLFPSNKSINRTSRINGSGHAQGIRRVPVAGGRIILWFRYKL